MNWEYLHPLISGAWNGAYTPNPVGDGEMWECPDFFPLDGGYVLIYSSMRKVVWQSGILDRATLKFHPTKSGLLDIDSFYAPKTQLDAQGRRILWGWIPEHRSQAEMIEAGWSGMMSLPRVLSLDPDGTLRMQPLPRTVTLRRESIEQRNAKARCVVTVPKAAGEVLCVGKKEEGVEFTVNFGERELLRLTYSPEQHAWLADGKNIVLQTSDVPKVHAFIDGSVIEVVLSERVGYTKRFYYSGAIAPDITVQANRGTVLTAWTISPISENRLTTTHSLA
jgi:beta-fructofuranosidase